MVTGTVSEPSIVIKDMGIDDGHDTRTLRLSQVYPGWILVHRGSKLNIDPMASDLADMQAIVKAFDLNTVPYGGHTWKTDGIVMRLRRCNTVRLVEHPVTGGVWVVENSADELNRSSVDVHTNNPGDQLNYLGTIAQPSGSNYGYPTCFAAWDPSELPDNAGIDVGTQFAEDPANDTPCAEFKPPLLTFPHTVRQ